jgi:RimJ/RimL family protein N-acetyltransferase
MRPSLFLRENIKLKDGRKVALRPIDRGDAGKLIDLHDHLSPESQYFRFFGPKPRLTPSEAEYLANVDFHNRFAIVAEVTEDGERHLIAVGRFDINEPGLAESAIVVRDDYQGVGLGTAILSRMREIARGRGLHAFVAEILAENGKMIDLLAANGLEVSRPVGGIVRVITPVDAPVLFKSFEIVARAAGTITETILEHRPGRRSKAPSD